VSRRKGKVRKHGETKEKSRRRIILGGEGERRYRENGGEKRRRRRRRRRQESGVRRRSQEESGGGGGGGGGEDLGPGSVEVGLLLAAIHIPSLREKVARVRYAFVQIALLPIPSQ